MVREHGHTFGCPISMQVMVGLERSVSGVIVINKYETTIRTFCKYR